MEVILKVGFGVSVLKLGRGMPQIYLTPGSIKDRRTSQSEPGIGNKSSGGGGEMGGIINHVSCQEGETLQRECFILLQVFWWNIYHKLQFFYAPYPTL